MHDMRSLRAADEVSSFKASMELEFEMDVMNALS